jgi:hypothetical protein
VPPHGAGRLQSSISPQMSAALLETTMASPGVSCSGAVPITGETGSGRSRNLGPGAFIVISLSRQPVVVRESLHSADIPANYVKKICQTCLIALESTGLGLASDID